MSLSRTAGPPQVGHSAFREAFVALERRLAAGRHFDVVRSQHGQLVLGNGHRAVVGAVHHRDRAAPEALPTQQPIPQPVVDGRRTQALLRQPVDGSPLGLGHLHSVHESGVDGYAIARPRSVLPVVGGLHGAHYRQAEGLGEAPVALILGGDGHDRPGAVGRQDVVGNEDRHRLAIERVHGVDPQGHAAVLRGRLGGLPFDLGDALDLLLEGLHLGALIRGSDLAYQRVLGGQHDIGHAEGGVGPGGEHVDGQTVLPLDGQREGRPFGTADPVALHGLDPLGPLQVVQGIQQFVGIGGDAEEPLLQLPLLDQIAGAFAGAVGQDLFVGQHGVAPGAPVDRGVGPVGQACLQKLQEDELVPLDIGRVVALDLAAPVVDGSQPLQGGLQLGDPVVGEGTGVGLRLDGGVLSGQTEAVETNGRQHVVTLHRAMADVQIAEGVVAHMPLVSRARRVGIHAEHVGAGSVAVVGHLVGALVGPVRLPALLDPLYVVRHQGIVKDRPAPTGRILARNPRRSAASSRAVAPAVRGHDLER